MSGFKVEFSVLNLRATPGIYADALASRPAAGYPGRVFIDTDNPSTGIYRDTGTVWVQIAETATSDVDTLQNVTDNGNTTTNSITVGAATTPAGTIDVRRATAALNNATDYGIVAISSPTIPNGAIFGVNNVNAIAGSEVLTFAGSATIGNNGLNSAGIFTNVLTSTGAGTVTVGQGSTLRSISGLQSVVYYNTAAATTFTHVAAIKTTQPINSGVAAASVTNNYGIIVADNTASSGTVTYTNRWGIYQEGASDKNYFAANVLIKSTTDNGNALQVTGSGNITGNLGLGTNSPTQKASIYGDLGIWNGAAGVTTEMVRFGRNTDEFRYNSIYNASSSGTSSLLQFRIHDGVTATSQATVMTLTGSGNVGIGTTTPTYKLEVSHNSELTGLIAGVGTSTTQNNGGAILAIRNTNNTNGNMESILFQNSAGTGVAAIIAYNTNHATGEGLMTFGTRNSTGTFVERMRITSAGSVGVNGTSPSGSLDIYGNTGTKIRIGYFTDQGTDDPTLRMFDGKNTRPSYSFTNDNTSGMFGGSGFVAFSTSASERMRITSGGEVLINTTTDVGDFKLQVSGNAYVSGTIGINATSPNAASLLQIDSTTQGFLLPRMTDAQITAISNPPDGLMVYSTDQNHIAFWNASAGVWKKVSNSNL